MGTTNRGFVSNFMAQIAEALIAKTKTIINDALDVKENGPKLKRYYRSGNYRCPNAFYNHGSRTFQKNRRKGL